MTTRELLESQELTAKQRVSLALQPGVLDSETRSRWLEKVTEKIVRSHAVACGIPDVERWACAWIEREQWARTPEAAARAERAARESGLLDYEQLQAARLAAWVAEAYAKATQKHPAMDAAWSMLAVARASKRRAYLTQAEDLLAILPEESYS